MASGDTKTQQYLGIAANGTRADLQRGCCNTRTQDLIMDVADRIITEEETRAREDQILQNEIDEIRNNPDVADIVPTYAALQDYDTSKLTDQDIIRVLADETHEGASTYYRWSSSSQAFTYVGEAGDYYTKNQMDALLDGKQDVLTAGENITIEDESGTLTISATDTTYTAGTGISINNGVISATSSGPTVVQTTGTSTTDVMSQNAVTSMVFADPATQYKIKIGNGTSSSEGSDAIEIGHNASAIGDNSVALGPGSLAYGAGSVILGSVAKTYSTGSVAVGADAYANADYSIALGDGSTASAKGEMNIGTKFNHGYSSSNYRLLSGLYDPQSAHDAATKGYCDNAIINGGTTAPATSTVGAVGTLYSYVDTSGTTPVPHMMVCIEVDSVTPSYTWVEAGGGSTQADSDAAQMNDINNGTIAPEDLENELNNLNNGN